MKSLMFTGIATSALIISAPAVAASDSFTGATSNTLITQIEASVEGTRSTVRSYGSRIRSGGFRGTRGSIGTRGKSFSRSHSFNNRSFNNRGFNNRGFKNRGFKNRGFNNRGFNNRGFNNRGFNNRGFVGFYQRPSYGFILPSYWLSSGFGISNYQTFGLSAPSTGYSWSRYYDDAVLRNASGTVVDSRQNIDWSQGGAGYAPNGYFNQVQQHQTTQPEFGPSIQAERSVYQSGQHVSASTVPNGNTPSGFYNGQWSDLTTDENGVTHGIWRGEVSDQNGQRYQATYRGTFTRDGTFQPTGAPIATAPVTNASNGFPAAPVAPVAPAQVQTPAGFESYERCLKGRGVKGGVLGAAIGAVAGNRIGGRGNRLEGSLIGGGVGALAGLGIEKALDKCERFLPVPQQQAPAIAQQQFPVAAAPVAQAPVFAQQQQFPVAAPVAQAPVFSQQQVGFSQAAPVFQQPAPLPAPQAQFQTPAEFGSYERCLRGRGVKGGVIGSVIGAVAGNRIAGRGNRLEGSLIGGGVGALAGLGIEKALDKCERFLPAPRQQVTHVAPQQHRGYYPQQTGYYYVPGGYYYPPAQTTVTVIPGKTTTTTTVTEEYVQSYSSGKRLTRPAVKRLRKPGY